MPAEIKPAVLIVGIISYPFFIFSGFTFILHIDYNIGDIILIIDTGIGYYEQCGHHADESKTDSLAISSEPDH